VPFLIRGINSKSLRGEISSYKIKINNSEWEEIPGEVYWEINTAEEGEKVKIELMVEERWIENEEEKISIDKAEKIIEIRELVALTEVEDLKQEGFADEYKIIRAIERARDEIIDMIGEDAYEDCLKEEPEDKIRAYEVKKAEFMLAVLRYKEMFPDIRSENVGDMSISYGTRYMEYGEIVEILRPYFLNPEVDPYNIYRF